MALKEQEKNVLEEIVTLNGTCMLKARCDKCPFRVMCLPEWVYPNPPSQEQRLKMAQDVLTHHGLLDEDTDIEEFKWDKN
jgi:hypothetical protein